MRWSWIDTDSENSHIELPASFIKMRKPHTVYLSRQAVEVLTELHGISGKSELVFPAVHAKRVIKRTMDGSEPQQVKRLNVRPISENTLNSALRRMGYGNSDHVSHGFRTSGSTLANESGSFESDIIESALNHMDEDKVRKIYNRARYEEKRRKLAQWFADECDRLREKRPAITGAYVLAMVRA